MRCSLSAVGRACFDVPMRQVSHECVRCWPRAKLPASLGASLLKQPMQKRHLRGVQSKMRYRLLNATLFFDLHQACEVVDVVWPTTARQGFIRHSATGPVRPSLPNSPPRAIGSTKRMGSAARPLLPSRKRAAVIHRLRLQLDESRGVRAKGWTYA